MDWDLRRTPAETGRNRFLIWTQCRIDSDYPKTRASTWDLAGRIRSGSSESEYAWRTIAGDDVSTWTETGNVWSGPRRSRSVESDDRRVRAKSGKLSGRNRWIAYRVWELTRAVHIVACWALGVAGGSSGSASPTEKFRGFFRTQWGTWGRNAGAPIRYCWAWANIQRSAGLTGVNFRRARTFAK